MTDCCFCRQKARLDGPPVLLRWAPLLLHSCIIAGLQRGKHVIPECTDESCCLTSSLYLASNPICAEIAKKMVMCLLIITIPATTPAHANKKLYYTYMQPVAGNSLDFLYPLIERWYHLNGSKQTKALHWQK